MDEKKALKLLDLEKGNFTVSDVQKKWRKLSLIYHPDKNLGNKKNEEWANEKTKEINNARDFLLKNFEHFSQPRSRESAKSNQYNRSKFEEQMSNSKNDWPPVKTSTSLEVFLEIFFHMPIFFVFLFFFAIKLFIKYSFWIYLKFKRRFSYFCLEDGIRASEQQTKSLLTRWPLRLALSHWNWKSIIFALSRRRRRIFRRWASYYK